jgi:3-oxoacyl-[acyl-carrier-protein] synthase II
MHAALVDAGLEPGAIGYVNAHGTGTPAGDPAEAESLRRVFGDCGVPVSSTKAQHGHLLGAGGAVELLVTLEALRSRRIPATASTRTVDPAFSIDLALGEARNSATLRHAMSNSFAFGGTNAVLVASRLD